MIGARIQTLRIAAGLTQDELAPLGSEGAGQVLSRWERGLQLPRLNTAAAIAEVLGAPMEPLVRDVGQEARAGSYGGRVATLVEQLPEAQAQARAVLMLAKNLVNGSD